MNKDEEDSFIKKWYDTIPENDEQRKFLLDTAHIFEHYVTTEQATKEHVLNTIRSKYTPSEIFNPNIMCNNALIKKFRHQLAGCGILPNPSTVLRESDRIILKIAYMIYPGENFRKERETAIAQINEYFQTTYDGGQSSAEIIPEPPTPKSVFNTKNKAASIEKETEQEESLLYKLIQGQQEQFKLLYESMQRDREELLKALNIREPTVSKLESSHNQDTESTIPTQFFNDSSHENQSLDRKRRPYHDISNRFKDSDTKYGGDEEEDLSEFLEAYSTVTKDYELTVEEKLQYMHNLFKKEALRYYNSSVKGKVTTFTEACKKMREHFNSGDKQTRVKNELQNIKFQDYVKKEGTRYKALNSITSYIANRSQLCSKFYRSESHRVDFLKKALLFEKWAQPTLRNIDDTTVYQNLCNQLAKDLLFFEEVDGQNNETVHTTNDADKPQIFFTQPRYSKQLTSKLFSGNERDRKCWNCGRQGHKHPKCRDPIDPVKIAANKAAFYEKKNRKQGNRKFNSSKQVLYEMAEGLRELISVDEGELEENDPSYTFFEMTDDSSNESNSDSEHSKKGVNHNRNNSDEEDFY